MRGLSLVAASGGHSSSRCAGLSLLRPLLLRSTGSRRSGSVVVAHGLSCSAACGTFPDQGSNPCPLHWQADSQPLHHQGSPTTLSFEAQWRTQQGHFCRVESWGFSGGKAGKGDPVSELWEAVLVSGVATLPCQGHIYQQEGGYGVGSQHRPGPALLWSHTGVSSLLHCVWVGAALYWRILWANRPLADGLARIQWDHSCWIKGTPNNPFRVDFLSQYLSEMLTCIMRQRPAFTWRGTRWKVFPAGGPQTQASHRASVVSIRVLSWERDISIPPEKMSRAKEPGFFFKADFADFGKLFH